MSGQRHFNETLFGNGVDAETKEIDLEKIGEIFKYKRSNH